MARSLRADIETPSSAVAKLLVSVSTDEIGCKYGLLNFIDVLRRLRQTICLRLKYRHRPAPVSPNGQTLLGNVFRTKPFEHIPTDHLELVQAQSGDEWRRRPEGPIPPPLVDPQIRKMFKLPDYTEWNSVPYHDLGPWCDEETGARGPEVRDDSRDFVLVVHPWGEDHIQLFEVRECIEPPRCPPRAKGEKLIACSNCKEEFLRHELSQTCCVFHPGVLFDEEDDSDCSDSTKANSDLDKYEGSEWSCCNTLYGSPGCVAERRHLEDSEVAPEYDERGITRPNNWKLLGYDSESEDDGGSEG
ncbi:hypothetical protein CERZMDRAFT_97366 [Cercospora zeae-maydis SCOH1-5]|uniref:C2H2-type domain-containing protein n=1 Tax=Cercospora zeae-maydis SCOH1-5 TaxID=717836 RepID=A0A6A6FHI0_9PEZI|nr:hypothetical protein CERZMDRAFT_97366 [Cercospora zeae-maydis SCOH1-5]